MGKWHFLGRSKPKKSLSELKTEVNRLKEAEKNVKSYNELQNEKARIMADIRREGFKTRHAKALAIINRAEGIMGNIGRKSYKIATSKKAKKYGKWLWKETYGHK